MKASLRFFAACAIASAVVNSFGIDLNAVRSGNWIQSDRAEARRSGGRSSRSSSWSNGSSSGRSTTSTSSWSNDSGSGQTSHTTSTWSDGYGTGQSSTTSTYSNSAWSNGSSSGRSSQSSTRHQSSYSGRIPPGASPSALLPSPVPGIHLELDIETDDAQPPVAQYDAGSDPMMRLMWLFLLLGGGIAAAFLVYLIYQQMAQRSPTS